jgi:hypothetical protein
MVEAKSHPVVKSQAMIVVFEYFEQRQLIKLQVLNKRFYNLFIPVLLKKVSLFELGSMSCGLMVWPKQDLINLLLPEASG